jgi:hypothetical protein
LDKVIACTDNDIQDFICVISEPMGWVSEIIRLTWDDLEIFDSKRGAAAQLQGVIFRLPEDGEGVINEYKSVIDPKTRKTICR